MSRAARWLTFGSAVTILFSIAASQILLGLALAALLLSGEKLQLPRIRLPLAIFLGGTILALILSPDRAAGLVQIRKFYVFGELLVVFSLMRDLALARWLFLVWAGFAGLTGIRGLVQFVQKVQQAQQAGSNSYDFYVGERITGFMSHWNTFSAQEMFALLMICSYLFFASGVRKRIWIWIGVACLMAVAVILGETRAVWIGTAVGGLYLLWYWRRWTIALVPVATLLVFLVSPAVVRDRVTSMIRPREVDSNQFRIVTWRTGLRMIEAHPLFGLGPEGPRIHFEQWVPADVPRPLPVGSYIHLHNIYLEYAAERGIPVLLVLVWLLVQMVYDFWRGARALEPGRSNRKFLLHGAVAVVLATMAEGFFEYNLGDSEVLTMFLVVTACGYLALEKDVVGA
jgi:putative inorganic carbon (hco3(-)) transporter